MKIWLVLAPTQLYVSQISPSCGCTPMGHVIWKIGTSINYVIARGIAANKLHCGIIELIPGSPYIPVSRGLDAAESMEFVQIPEEYT